MPLIKPVRQCVCFGVTFEEIKTAGLDSLDAIQYGLGVGSNCGMCRPYVELMLRTGETAFEVLPLPKDLEDPS